jgi:hypothetical protein
MLKKKEHQLVSKIREKKNLGNPTILPLSWSILLPQGLVELSDFHWMLKLPSAFLPFVASVGWDHAVRTVICPTQSQFCHKVTYWILLVVP